MTINMCYDKAAPLVGIEVYGRLLRYNNVAFEPETINNFGACGKWSKS